MVISFRIHVLRRTKHCRCLPAMEGFKVALIKTKEEFESVYVNAAVEEGWRPGLEDAECCLAGDPS